MALSPKNKVKVFLVGGFGFIGRRFIRKFSNIHQLIVYAHNSHILQQDKTLPQNIIFEKGTVEDDKLIGIILKYKPDVVVHLAALTGIKKCQDNPEVAFKVNVYGTFNVINACVKSGAKLVFISSREVYGDTLNNNSMEDDPLLPNNVYGVTKMIGEILVKQASQKYNLDYTILRLTNVYGPEGDQYGAQVMIKSAIKEKKILVHGGDQYLNFIYVDDVVDLINLVINERDASKQTFNVGSTDTLSIKQFARMIVSAMVDDVQIEYTSMRKGETQNFKPSIKKLEEKLGYVASTSLQTGLEKTIKWTLDIT
jgi:nucleoside-diphosphate-sugar epimerase